MYFFPSRPPIFYGLSVLRLALQAASDVLMMLLIVASAAELTFNSSTGTHDAPSRQTPQPSASPPPFALPPVSGLATGIFIMSLLPSFGFVVIIYIWGLGALVRSCCCPRSAPSAEEREPLMPAVRNSAIFNTRLCLPVFLIAGVPMLALIAALAPLLKLILPIILLSMISIHFKRLGRLEILPRFIPSREGPKEDKDARARMWLFAAVESFLIALDVPMHAALTIFLLTKVDFSAISGTSFWDLAVARCVVSVALLPFSVASVVNFGRVLYYGPPR